MNGTVLKNGPLLGGSIGIAAFQLAPYVAYLLSSQTTDPVAWGLLLVASTVTSMLAYVGAEVSSAIRSLG